MNINEIKEKILDKINENLNYITSLSSTEKDVDISNMVLKLSQTYAILNNIDKENNNEK